jgi:hypothetical protein
MRNNDQAIVGVWTAMMAPEVTSREDGQSSGGGGSYGAKKRANRALLQLPKIGQKNGRRN